MKAYPVRHPLAPLADILIPEPFVILGHPVCRQCWNGSHTACAGLPNHCDCPCTADRIAQAIETLQTVLDEFLWEQQDEICKKLGFVREPEKERN